MQYNTFFQAYVNSLLPLIATIISIALGIAGGVMASTLVKRYKTIRAKRQIVIPSRTSTRSHRTTKTQSASVKPKQKTTTATALRPLRPTSTTPKPTRTIPTVAVPRYILEPEKTETKEKGPAKSETASDKSHSKDGANQRTPR